jgi:hypothetical protein
MSDAGFAHLKSISEFWDAYKEYYRTCGEAPQSMEGLAWFCEGVSLPLQAEDVAAKYQISWGIVPSSECPAERVLAVSRDCTSNVCIKLYSDGTISSINMP